MSGKVLEKRGSLNVKFMAVGVAEAADGDRSTNLMLDGDMPSMGIPPDKRLVFQTNGPMIEIYWEDKPQ